MAREPLISHLLRIRNMPIDRAIKVLREQNLLHSALNCKVCGERMKEYSRNDQKDESRWRCTNIMCEKHGVSCSIREGSFFADYKTSVVDVWTVVVCWISNVQIKAVVDTYGISKYVVIRVYYFLRILVHNHLMSSPIKLGGPGIVVQIDESLLSYKPKYNRGHISREQVWGFGIADTSFTPAKVYVEIVPNRNRATLFEIISRVCLPGTVIHSDQWAAYRTINRDLGFEHLSVNHSLNFVNPETGCHTQNIESFWNRLKRPLKAMNGIRYENLPFYLSEINWKNTYRERTLVVLLGLLRAR